MSTIKPYKGNHVAKELRTPKYRQRVVEDKSKYSRKRSPNKIVGG